MMVIPTYRVKFKLNHDGDNVPSVVTIRVAQTDLGAVMRVVNFNRFEWFQVEREADPLGLQIAGGTGISSASKGTDTQPGRP